MNEIFDKILWHIYSNTEHRIRSHGDVRFILRNILRVSIHELTGKQLSKAINSLECQKLVEKKNYESSVLVSLTEKGILRAINYSFKNLGHKKENWDGKWRMVSFDIPESRRKGRNALRYRMKMGNFYEFQKSLFVYPYDCKKEIENVVKLFKLEKYVRFGTLDSIDIQDKLKFHFRLS